MRYSYKISIISFLLFMMFLFFNADASAEIKAKSNKWEKIKAWKRYKEGDYYGALRIYRDIYEKNKYDLKINYRIGLCHFALQDMEKTIEFMEKAIEIGNKKRQYDNKFAKKSHFILGQAYQYLGDIEKALNEYNIYDRSLKASKLRSSPVKEYIKQCSIAQSMMASPVNVVIKNLGKAINSEYDDAIPSITADGKTLIFTSRRADTKGGGIDPNTGKYYDDIYISTWNEQKKTWNEAKGAPGNLNTDGHDACLSISPDGNTIFVYRNIPGVTGSGDIFISNLKNDSWTSPKSLPRPINTSFFESSACLSPDGNYLYFVSERPGGYGNADIWVSKKIGKNEWEKPINLGPNINTAEDELGVFIHADGKTLFFTSKGHNSMGGYDVFVSRNDEGKWSHPINLGYPINTTKDELHFTLTADGKKAYISSRKDGGFGEADIYEIDLSNYQFPIPELYTDTTTLVEKSSFNPEISILKGQVIDADAGQALPDVEISITYTDNEQNIVNIVSDDTGNYFITLKGNKEYIISIEKNRYKTYYDKITLPLSNKETFTLVKTIVLERIKE